MFMELQSKIRGVNFKIHELRVIFDFATIEINKLGLISRKSEFNKFSRQLDRLIELSHSIHEDLLKIDAMLHPKKGESKYMKK